MDNEDLVTVTPQQARMVIEELKASIEKMFTTDNPELRDNYDHWSLLILQSVEIAGVSLVAKYTIKQFEMLFQLNKSLNEIPEE